MRNFLSYFFLCEKTNQLDKTYVENMKMGTTVELTIYLFEPWGV